MKKPWIILIFLVLLFIVTIFVIKLPQNAQDAVSVAASVITLLASLVSVWNLVTIDGIRKELFKKEKSTQTVNCIESTMKQIKSNFKTKKPTKDLLYTLKNHINTIIDDNNLPKDKLNNFLSDIENIEEINDNNLKICERAFDGIKAAYEASVKI